MSLLFFTNVCSFYFWFNTEYHNTRQEVQERNVLLRQSFAEFNVKLYKTMEHLYKYIND